MQKLIKNKAGFSGILTIITLKNGKEIRRSKPMKNLVVSSNGYGRNLIIRKLAGDNTYGIQIDSAAVGDGTTAPVDGNTGLENSLVSGISISNTTVANDIITIDVFASDATLPNDDYKEFGLFIGGRLFSRVLISPTYTKATGEDTIFSYQITLSAI